MNENKVTFNCAMTKNNSHSAAILLLLFTDLFKEKIFGNARR